MLKISFEFRKGIFFVRLIGDLRKDNIERIKTELQTLITINGFKYIVINTNYLNTIDMAGLNYITEVCYIANNNESNLIICDKTNIFKTLLNNNFPSISDELEVL